MGANHSRITGKDREMGKCTVCSHSKRSEIETALAQGESYRNIAKQYGLGYSAVNRHAHKCIGQSLAVVQGGREQLSGVNILAELKSINAECKAILSSSKAKKDDRLSLQAIDRLCAQLALQARFLEVLQKQGDPGIAAKIEQDRMKEREKEYRELFERYEKERDANKVRTIVFYPPYPPEECQECATYHAKVKPYERDGEENAEGWADSDRSRPRLAA